MPALNFQQRFAPDVEARIKKTSIRAKDRFKVGNPIQLYTGMRTKQCRKLSDVDPICQAVKPIRIEYDGVFTEGHLMLPQTIETIAKMDGFDSIASFIDFFRQTYGLPFDGYLIRWDWEE